MRVKLPHWSNSNIRGFYLLSLFNEAFFFVGNWIFFWTRFMTYGTLGIVDAIAFAFGLIMEIPTGAIADLLGKKLTIMVAMALNTLGFLLISSATQMTGIVIGFLIAQVGWALYSGSAEALAYDTLKDEKQQDTYAQVISTSHLISIVSAAVATLIGGYLYFVHFRLPHFAVATNFLIAFLISFTLREPKTDTETFSWSGYLTQMKRGASHLFNSALRRYVLFFFIIQGIYFIYSWGFIKPAMATSFGFLEVQQPILFAILGLLGAIIVKLIPWMRTHISDLTGLITLSITLSLGFFIAGLTSNPTIGLITIIFITVAGKLSSPWVSIVVNHKIESKYRATTLSTLALINKVPYVFIAIIAGTMIENGDLSTFISRLGITIFACTLVGLYLNKRLA